MNLKNIKATVAVVWIFAIGAVGLLADVSLSSWLVLAGCAIVPPLVMMRYWNYPDETTSQSIQQILR
jgi:hypothetical protein